MSAFPYPTKVTVADIILYTTVTECTEGEIRLAGGVTNSIGRLEVCANGAWGRVCNTLQYWGPDNARVVCRQLHFLEQGKTSHNMYTS